MVYNILTDEIFVDILSDFGQNWNISFTMFQISKDQ